MTAKTAAESPTRATREIALAHCTLVVLDRYRVDVRFPGGKYVAGERLPTAENLAQAVELGYPETDNGVSAALFDHELLHCLVGEVLFDGKSPTLWHEAQGEYAPYYLRLWEESVVLALQLWLNGRDVGDRPWPLSGLLWQQLSQIQARYYEQVTR